jgi:hypothetical protein
MIYDREIVSTIESCERIGSMQCTAAPIRPVTIHNLRRDSLSQGCLCCTVGDLHGHDVYGKYRMRSVTSGGAITFFVSASDETTTKEERSLPTLLIAGR